MALTFHVVLFLQTFKLTLHQRGQRLDLSVYQQSVKALTDDYEGVRLAALKLVWVLSQVYPEEMLAVKGGSTEDQLRLVDDGFTNICQMVSCFNLVFL